MDKIKCNSCDKDFTTIKGLSNHRFQKHGIKPQETYNEYVLDNTSPKCKCGCGETPKFLSIVKGYRDYIRGHSQRVVNNWGHNKSALDKSHATQKEMYKSGELVVWNKGLTVDDPRVRGNIDKVMANPNRGKNISKKLKGVSKSEEHKQKLSETAIIRWSDPLEREKQACRVISRLVKNNYRNPKTKLEETFEDILKGLGVDYVYQHVLFTKMFDFYLPDFNMLIEVDGDFHHCNPNSKHKIPKYGIQKNTLKNDSLKNSLCEDNNIRLVRFWESDIKNDLPSVIRTLKALIT